MIFPQECPPATSGGGIHWQSEEIYDYSDIPNVFIFIRYGRHRSSPSLDRRAGVSATMDHGQFMRLGWVAHTT